MFHRFSFFFFIATIVTMFVVVAQAEKSVDSRAKIPSSAIKAGAKLIGKSFAGAAAGCLIEAATHCKSQLKHPKQLIKCGGDYLKQNKGRCLAG